jgi:subtilase family serine protease
VKRRRFALLATSLVAPIIMTVSSTSPVHAATASEPPSKADRIKVLTHVLDFMRTNYAKFAKSTPGPRDVFDYKIGDLWKKGIDGSGTTVAVIEGWDDPQVNSVVHTFDQKYGLPDPQIQTIYPSGNGKLPAQCPPGMVALGSYGSCDAWAGELELDVISAHLVAPYAKILISATPADSEVTDDAASQVAPYEMMQALEYIGEHHLANAISISDGTGESTYSHGKTEITAQDPGLLTAAAAGIPVLNATGDCGVVQNLAVANAQCGNTSPGPDTATWDDSPWVTAVGGSIPNMDATGNKAGPDPVWHAGIFSPGAGFSSVYKRPAYQDAVKSITGSTMRSVPDITMDAQHGTSEAAPLFAGIIALAAQMNHGNVGPINDVLYKLGRYGANAGIADVVSGNNSTPTVQGFTAAPGFDVVSGWGTVDASRFVPSLVAGVRASGENAAVRFRAWETLRRLESGVRLSTHHIRAGRSASLSDTGFLPGHPVRLTIDNHNVAVLTADSTGSVSYTISPSSLGLSHGHHVVTLTSMLLTARTAFVSG